MSKFKLTTTQRDLSAEAIASQFLMSSVLPFLP